MNDTWNLVLAAWDFAVAIWNLLVSIAVLVMLIGACVYGFHGDYQHATWLITIVILAEILKRRDQ